jgi:hypothetical protein
MLRRLLVLRQRGDRDKVGTRNIFPLQRYLKSSIFWHHLAIFLELTIHTQMIGCGQGGKHKRWYFWF